LRQQRREPQQRRTLIGSLAIEQVCEHCDIENGSSKVARHVVVHLPDEILTMEIVVCVGGVDGERRIYAL
jgi:hypothetical protein